MWLLPALSGLSDFAVRVFYRFSVSGPEPPSDGPALFLANHPNSLIDPALVGAAAGRSLRFLAKAPLFSDPVIGWMVRASGAIPVYRRADYEQEVADRNEAMFSAVTDALADGSAVGIFPEGISHNDPALAKLKTGTARIALDYAKQHGNDFALIPVGLVLRDKGIFRSMALAIRGNPVPWSDLIGRGSDDAEAVRELTDRLEAALREVTLNLEQWEDLPLVTTARGVWASEFGRAPGLETRVRRAQQIADVLCDVRRRDEEDGQQLVKNLDSHRRRLNALGLQPLDLTTRTDLETSLTWVTRRFLLLLPPVLILAALGWVVSLPPYLATALTVRVSKPSDDTRSTYQLLIGGLFHFLWLVLLVGLSWWKLGGWFALFAAAVLPGLQILALWVRERWGRAWRDARRFFKLRSRKDLVAKLQDEQSQLARQMESLYSDWEGENP